MMHFEKQKLYLARTGVSGASKFYFYRIDDAAQNRKKQNHFEKTFNLYSSEKCEEHQKEIINHANINT